MAIKLASIKQKPIKDIVRQDHSYKQKNYLHKEPIFNEKNEQPAALPPTILKLKAIPDTGKFQRNKSN